jgi:phosphoenolpyruvate carboxykinase (GTP)
VGQLRRDPFAMLPFCGYHMGDYFAHWLTMPSRTDAAKLPRLYYVNWFRQDESGRFVWPGYGDNSRVLKWVFERVAGTAGAVDTPIGRLPAPGALDVAGVEIGPRDLEAITSVDVEGWLGELPLIRSHYEQFGDRLPKELWYELDLMEGRLKAARV